MSPGSPLSLPELYDTTLRDGTQAEDISFTVEDKLRIAQRLDEFGIHYIEGGWPGSNPRDNEFFSRVRRGEIRLNHARLAAFGSTRRKGVAAEADKNLNSLLKAGTPVITIFGKSWDLHVREALHVSLEENLEMIGESIAFLKGRVGEVIYDAEHFFDGYKANPDYSIKTIRAAVQGGADRIVLCDTNGGRLPREITEIVTGVRDYLAGACGCAPHLGIHCHNDGELAVANSLAAIEAGVGQVHGTINGIGERCGNANLISIIPALKLKLGIDCVSDDQLKGLRDLSRFVDELANRIPFTHQPYVGESAFAHKGGIHVSAILKKSETYEHLDPGLVGNCRRILLSDLSGQSNVLYKAREFGIDLDGNDRTTRRIVEGLKRLEHEGYQFEGAEGSFEILMARALKRYRPFFRLIRFRVMDEKGEKSSPHAEAVIQIEVDGRRERSSARGVGPVNALDQALRKALRRFYPRISEVKLVDYKVRVLPAGKGTASQVRVLIESRDKKDSWGTVGVSPNIVQASWQALVDSLEYKLMKDKKKS